MTKIRFVIKKVLHETIKRQHKLQPAIIGSESKRTIKKDVRIKEL